MPELDGAGAIEIIKGNPNSSTKIIILTASALETEKIKIMAMGCDDFIRKPFKTDELLLTVAKHLGLCYTLCRSKYWENSISPTNYRKLRF